MRAGGETFFDKPETHEWLLIRFQVLARSRAAEPGRLFPGCQIYRPVERWSSSTRRSEGLLLWYPAVPPRVNAPTRRGPARGWARAEFRRRPWPAAGPPQPPEVEMDVLVIGHADVRRLLPMAACVEVMERAFRSRAAGHTVLPLRTALRLPDRRGLLG